MTTLTDIRELAELLDRASLYSTTQAVRDVIEAVDRALDGADIIPETGRRLVDISATVRLRCVPRYDAALLVAACLLGIALLDVHDGVPADVPLGLAQRHIEAALDTWAVTP